jgi:signal transduction histidine kinase
VQLRVLFVLLVMLPALCFAESYPRKVLVLHSYHQGLEWTDAITKGIQDTFRKSDEVFAIDFNYLDTKRNTSPEYFAQLQTLYSQKSQLIHYEAILVSDNNALNFYLQNRAFFPHDPPVIFCGVNQYTPKMLDGARNVTGVVEATDFTGTLEWMLRLHPTAKRILVINDQTPTGKAIKAQLLEVLPQFATRVKFEFMESINFNTLSADLAELGPNDLIYLLAVNKDAAGRFVSYKYGAAMLRQSTDVPIYGSWEFYLGKGIVGGNMVSGYSQGTMAAELALRILGGERVQSIPVVETLPDNYQFDYEELRRLGIPLDRLPKGARLINRPSIFSRELIAFIIVVFGGLICVVAGLFFSVLNGKARRRRLERDKLLLDEKVADRTKRLKKANRSLKNEVDERRRIEEQLRDSNEMKDKFFSIIAHDLKNPFTGLIGLTEMLKEGWDAFSREEMDNCLSELHSQSKSTFELLQNLLTWANLKQQGFCDAPEWQNLKETVDQSVGLVRSNAMAKQIRMENLIEERFEVYLDKFILTTVLNNLCGNAIKFTPVGGLIQIDAKCEGSNVVIQVVDSGIGIERDVMEQLFSLSGAHSRQGTQNETGTGLGLVICRELIEQVGGTIRAQSAGAGQGTAMIFSLPQRGLDDLDRPQ